MAFSRRGNGRSGWQLPSSRDGSPTARVKSSGGLIRATAGVHINSNSVFVVPKSDLVIFICVFVPLFWRMAVEGRPGG